MSIFWLKYILIVLFKLKSKAIKKYNTFYPKISAQITNEIEKEANILRQLHHENVIKFFDYILEDVPKVGNLVYIVTEYFQVHFYDCRCWFTFWKKV